jgi:hypothetical protein
MWWYQSHKPVGLDMQWWFIGHEFIGLARNDEIGYTKRWGLYVNDNWGSANPRGLICKMIQGSRTRDICLMPTMQAHYNKDMWGEGIWYCTSITVFKSIGWWARTRVWSMPSVRLGRQHKSIPERSKKLENCVLYNKVRIFSFRLVL